MEQIKLVMKCGLWLHVRNLHKVFNISTETGHICLIDFLLVNDASDFPYGTTHSGYGTTPLGCRSGNRYVEGGLCALLSLPGEPYVLY